MIDESIIIDSVKIIEVSIPYVIPFQISGGTSYKRKSILVEFKSGNITAFGESAPFEQPFYSSETISTVKSIIVENLLPKIVGKRFNSIKHFNKVINKNIRGNNFAKCGVETAYWDLIAKKNNITLKKAP